MAVGAFHGADILPGGTRAMLTFDVPTALHWKPIFPLTELAISRPVFTISGHTPHLASIDSEVIDGDGRLMVTITLDYAIPAGTATTVTIGAAWLTDPDGNASGATTGTAVRSVVRAKNRPDLGPRNLKL